MTVVSLQGELVEAALEELPSTNWRARRWIIATAVRYRRMTDPRGLLQNAARFAQLRSALLKEQERSTKLARDITACTKRLQLAFSRLAVGYDEQRKISDNRVELALLLKRNATEIESVDRRWPKGGRGLNLATTKYGPPNEWLVNECQKIFWHYGNINHISYPNFHIFVGYIFELATGQDPDAEGVGLNTVVDKFVRHWRQKKNQNSSNF